MNTEIVDTEIVDTIIKLDKNILIYPHQPFSINDGGVTVHYYLAYILSNLGINVKIFNTQDNNAPNPIFNNEKEMIDKNIDFKILSLFYIHPEIENMNNERKGLCYTIRKKIILRAILT